MTPVAPFRRLIVALLLSACAHPSPDRPLGSNGGVPTVDPDPASPSPPCERIVHIEVAKSERVLRAYCARGALVTMTAAMGREPHGPKRTVGDLRTPEGRYRIAGSAKPSRFHAFLPIDYPSVADADRALAAGRIGARDHAEILAAHRRGELPPAHTPLGGDIGFHGEGRRWQGDSRTLDWTLGCIAVTDEEIDFLITRIETGVPVEILP